MNLITSRRRFLTLAGASAAAALAGCGSSSVASAIDPQRFYVVGDGFSDVGQTGTLPTINDGSPNWIQTLASYYDLSVTPRSAGGAGYAQIGARIDAPDTTSGTNAPSVRQQIDQLLADVPRFENDDLVFINGGMHDIVDAFNATGISAETTAAVRAAGQALGAQVRRLLDAGATHVCVTGVYSLSISPWGRATGFGAGDDREGFGEGSPLNSLSNTFNNAGLKVSIADWGANVLYFDAALFYNLIASSPESFQIAETLTPACTAPTVLTCTPDTVRNPDYNAWLFADDLHFTPEAQRIFVSENYAANAYTLLRNRW
jgi:phospholipase/lecithinase/hemolysin